MPMSYDALLTLCVLVAASTWTPGPNHALLASSGANFGLHRTVPHALGVALGFPVMVLIVGLFLGSAFQHSALLRMILHYGGAALLLYVAWKIAFYGGLVRADGNRRPFRFHEAAAFQWINPKGWVMAISLTSQFVSATQPVTSAVVVALVFLLVGLTSAFAWAAGGTAMRRFLAVGHRLGIFNGVMGRVLALGMIVLLRHYTRSH